MRVHEDRLGEIRDRIVPIAALRRANPLVVEAIDELLRTLDLVAERRIAARDAAVSFAAVLGLDQPASRRVRLPVAARTALRLADLQHAAVLRELHDLVRGDAMLAMVCDGLVGYRSSGGRRPRAEQAAVLRALCAVAHMAAAQEQCDELEALVVDDEVRPGAR